MDKGWIKLHRQLLSHWIFVDPVALKIWIYLLLIVNHEEKKALIGGELISIKAGQTMTSIRKIAAETDTSRYKVSRTLEAMKKDGMIITKNIQHGTLVNISNYKRFQRISGNTSASDFATDCASDFANGLANDLASDFAQTINTRITKNDKQPKKPAPRMDEFGNVIEE